MASTSSVARLTEAHRLGQARISAVTAQKILQSWSLIDLADLAASSVQWLKLAALVVLQQRSVSTGLAVDYMRTVRQLELGPSADTFAPVVASPLDPQLLTATLVDAGPGSLQKSLAAGRDVLEAVDAAKARAAGMASFHAVNGGSETVIATVESDPRAVGWKRVTSGATCAFCTMLAGRGAVYKSRRTANFRPHINCDCQPQPLYAA